MKNLTHSLVVALTLIAIAQPSFAEGNFKQKHPRRAGVNERVSNQRKRIEQGEKTGKLTEGEANQLEKRDNQIKREERRDVKENGGSLTKAEQKKINGELNANSKNISQEEREKKAAPNSAVRAVPAVPASGNSN